MLQHVAALRAAGFDLIEPEHLGVQSASSIHSVWQVSSGSQLTVDVTGRLAISDGLPAFVRCDGQMKISLHCSLFCCGWLFRPSCLLSSYTLFFWCVLQS